MSQQFAFISYETRFAPAGGIAAVMNYLPSYLQKASRLETIVVTPFHYKTEATFKSEQKMNSVGNIEVSVGVGEARETILVDILGLTHNNHSWYFLKPVGHPELFAGTPNPYRVGRTPEETSRILLHDSLFFGVAVSKALSAIDKSAEWILLMQDWEAATTALALARQKRRHKLFLTLHNSYDSGAVDDKRLEWFGIDPESCRGPKGWWDPTILQRALLITEEKAFTVSDQFAIDIVEDIFQTKIMAPHLQSQFKMGQESKLYSIGNEPFVNILVHNTRLYGIDNGPFTELQIPIDIMAAASRGNYDPIIKWKSDEKANAVTALRNHQSSAEKPVWGDVFKFTEKDDLWFVLAGRDDTRQKGYDVAALAISEYLSRSGKAKFLFFPLPGEEGFEGLTFLETLAKTYPHNVLVLPFIWKEGYFAALRAATYGIMPSLYEPFGMANEFYLNGTCGIGRATGGLLQQIIPLKAVSAYSKAVQERITRLHLFSAPPTGILYREKDGIETAINDWHGINEAKYNLPDNQRNRVEERKSYPLFRAMAEELSLSIEDGIHIYQDKPILYYKMLVEGISHIQRTFAWERNAHEYIREIL